MRSRKCWGHQKDKKEIKALFVINCHFCEVPCSCGLVRFSYRLYSILVLEIQAQNDISSKLVGYFLLEGIRRSFAQEALQKVKCARDPEQSCIYHTVNTPVNYCTIFVETSPTCCACTL